MVGCDAILNLLDLSRTRTYLEPGCTFGMRSPSNRAQKGWETLAKDEKGASPNRFHSL